MKRRARGKSLDDFVFDTTTASGLLGDVFDRGLREGERSLSRADRELFRIQDFIIETEMGGLTGYLYNRVSKRGALGATARALEKWQVRPLAPIVRELAGRFEGWRARGDEEWDDVRTRYVPNRRLRALEQQFERARAQGFGLEQSKVASRVKRRLATSTRGA